MSSELMRRLLQILEESVNPQLDTYMKNNPESVSVHMEDLVNNLKKDAQAGDRFSWAIARLPDGKFIQVFPRFAQQWNLPIVQQGTHEDLHEQQLRN